MSLLRALRPLPRLALTPAPSLAGPSRTRTYAKSHKSKPKDPEPEHAKRAPRDTAALVPGSHSHGGLAGDPEYARAETKMAHAAEWLRRALAQMDARAAGRVTPALLAPVRVGGAPLEALATVGVRDGSVLVVTVFDPDSLKAVEAALWDAKLPGIVPQRADERTIRIPIPKPTVDARLAMYAAAARQAEESRVQIRRLHHASVKKGKYEKHSVELEEFQKLQDRYIAEIDASLANLKKSTGAR